MQYQTFFFSYRNNCYNCDAIRCRQSNDTINISYVSINAYFKIASIWNLRNSVSFSLIQRDNLFINPRTILLSSTYSVSIYLREITHCLQSTILKKRRHRIQCTGCASTDTHITKLTLFFFIENYYLKKTQLSNFRNHRRQRRTFGTTLIRHAYSQKFIIHAKCTFELM